MERISKKIGTNRKPATVPMPIRNEAAIDDHAIMEHLFGILSLEKQVSSALARRNVVGERSARALVAELNTRVARFDRILSEAEACSAAMAS